MDLFDQVDQTIRSRALLKRGARVIVAVSGGLDSMVLLHVLQVLAVNQRWQLVVAHFNHRLRGSSSGADQRLVRRVAEGCGLEFIAESQAVKPLAKAQGISVEMAARDLRHTFLARVGRQYKVRRIALGHHAQDQVELFFLRLLRGSGSGGLSGMKWCNPSPADRSLTLIRPFLNQTREALLDHAREHKVKFREDASNQTLDILRNRIRHQLLPFLRNKFQPALGPVILRQMEIFSAEDDFLSQEVDIRLQGRGGDSFARWPVALQRRFLQRQLQQLHLSAGFDLVEELRTGPVKRIMVGPDKTVRRQANGTVELIPAATPRFNENVLAIALQGAAGDIVFGGRKFQWALLEKKGKPRSRKARCEWFDADKIGEKVILRHWRQGDRFQPIGMKQPVKLQNLFTNVKVPLLERRRRVVACTERGDLWWVEGLRISDRFKIRPKTRRQLRWAWGQGEGSR